MESEVLVKGKRYKPKEAAFWLSVDPKTFAKWYREGEVLKRGTEIIKVGGDLRIDVCAYLDRIAKEQQSVRRV